MPQDPPPITASELVARYDGLLLDAYGVLVDGGGARSQGVALLAAARAAGKPFCVVTNDASRLPSTAAARFHRCGLDIPPERILSSGSLLASYFATADLIGAATLVLGPEDSRRYVRAAGGEPLPLDTPTLPDALVVCDENGYPFLGVLDHTLTLLYRAGEVGRLPALILANPDLVYPRGPQSWGFTAGSIALLLEAALARRWPTARKRRFVRLGKPGPELFRCALERLQIGGAVMVGDQLETDIAGARAAGLDSALVGELPSGWRGPLPTWRLDHPDAAGEGSP